MEPVQQKVTISIKNRYRDGGWIDAISSRNGLVQSYAKYKFYTLLTTNTFDSIIIEGNIVIWEKLAKIMLKGGGSPIWLAWRYE